MIKTILACAALAAADDFSQWAHFKDVSADTRGVISADQAKFPLLIRLGAAEADVFSGALPGGADVRFASPGGAHLAYQIERWDAAAKQAEIWVATDVKGNANAVALRLYWGKAGAADSGSGAAVFAKENGYQGVWHLEPALADAGGNAGASDDHGSVDAAGAVGRGRRFNGTSAYLRLGKAAGQNVVGRITMEAWVRWLDGGASGTQGRRHFLAHGNGAEGPKVETTMRLINDKYYAGTYIAATKSEVAATSPTAGDSAVWVHLAGVYDKVAWRLYRNGVETASKPDTAQGALASDSAWYVGSWSPAARFFSGDLDEVRISSVPRSADWLKLGYASQKAGATVVSLGPTQGSSALRGAAPRVQGNFQGTAYDLAGRRAEGRSWSWSRSKP